ncbi:hypothetical protein [Yinghuangia sp. YIM S09857]|uniref:hypothetical protein n=1 Tax=Yinghuangia sp. YIM S09857 TaxID=3436929 RepID=UPI003F5341A6
MKYRRALGFAAAALVVGAAVGGCSDDGDGGGDETPTPPAPTTASGPTQGTPSPDATATTSGTSPGTTAASPRPTATGTAQDKYSGLADPHIAEYLRGVDAIGDKYGVEETGNTVEQRAANVVNMRNTLCAKDGRGGYRPSAAGRAATSQIIASGADSLGVPPERFPEFREELLNLGESTLCVPK